MIRRELMSDENWPKEMPDSRRGIADGLGSLLTDQGFGDGAEPMEMLRALETAVAMASWTMRMFFMGWS
jgi:hypothetical protein